MTAAYAEITTPFTIEEHTFSLKIYTFFNSSDGQYLKNKRASYKVYVITFTAVLAIILNWLSMLATLHVPGKLTSHLKYILSIFVSYTPLPWAITSSDINEAVLPGSAIHVAVKPGISNNVLQTLHSECATMVISIMRHISILATQFILVAMAFDSYIAINKPLQKRTRTGKANFVILLVWFAASTISLSNVIVGIHGFYYNRSSFRNFCQCIKTDDYFVEYIIYGTTIICLTIVMATCGQIFCSVKDLASGMQEQRPRNRLPNKKALATTLLIVGCLFLFDLPLCFYPAVLRIIIEIEPRSLIGMMHTLSTIYNWLYLMEMLNSVCDPIMYALRLKDVQCGYNIIKSKLQRLFVRSQDHQYRYSYQYTTSSRPRT